MYVATVFQGLIEICPEAVGSFLIFHNFYVHKHLACGFFNTSGLLPAGITIH